MSISMRSWSALLFSFSLFLAYRCRQRLLVGIFLAKGFGGCSVGAGLTEKQISEEDQIWGSGESWMACFFLRRVHRPSYRFLLLTLPTLCLFHLSLIFDFRCEGLWMMLCRRGADREADFGGGPDLGFC